MIYTENTTYNKLSISMKLAEQMIQAAVMRAKEMNQNMVIAILDESAHLKSFHRMDHSPLISITLAQNKAYTAITHPWGLSTQEIYRHMQEYPAVLASIGNIPRYIVFGGGYIIKTQHQIIGGLGVSGGTVEQDALVAEAALQVSQTFFTSK